MLVIASIPLSDIFWHTFRFNHSRLKRASGHSVFTSLRWLSTTPWANSRLICFTCRYLGYTIWKHDEWLLLKLSKHSQQVEFKHSPVSKYQTFLYCKLTKDRAAKSRSPALVISRKLMVWKGTINTLNQISIIFLKTWKDLKEVKV
jgi:hypothetical protein